MAIELEKSDYEGAVIEEDAVPPTESPVIDDDDDDESLVGSDISADSLTVDVGEVSDKQIAAGLSNRGYSADAMEIAYLNLGLANNQLTNISKLVNFRYIQNLDISCNNLSEINVISELKYMLTLNASNNRLQEVPCLNPPFNIVSADFSHNQITDMSSIGDAHTLKSLNLSNNKISRITGLDSCRRLRHLKLNSNQISEINGLQNLQLHSLELNYNNLNKIAGLENLISLQSLQLSYNGIRSLRGLGDKFMLHTLNLEGNNIVDILEVKLLTGLPLLRHLSLISNPLNTIPSYRSNVLFYLPHLVTLDEAATLPEEKIGAVNEFATPMDEIAAQNHMRMLVADLRNITPIKPSTMAEDGVTYPVLILTGPSGSQKHELAHQLVKHCRNSFRVVKFYTTRMSADTANYIPMDEEQFEKLAESGWFIVTFEVGGASYGLSGYDLEGAAADGIASVLCMELEGILSFLRTSYKPKIVLLSPEDPTQHERLMRERGWYPEPMIALALKRSAMYTDYHDKNTGVFDLAVDSTDSRKAFEKIVQLVDFYSGYRSGVGPGQHDVIPAGTPESGFKQWSCGSSSTFDTLQNLPRKRAAIESAMRGETATSPKPDDSGKEVVDFRNVEFTSTSELSATIPSMSHLKQVVLSTSHTVA